MNTARTKRSLLAVVTAAVCLLTTASGLHAKESPTPHRPLQILLTNDDGHDAPGIHKLRDALRQAGHRVTVVSTQESRGGTGTAMTNSGTLKATMPAPNEWVIDGTPSDAVTFGTQVALGGQRPDLVISGINRGQNVGKPLINHSATVGAAVTALQYDIPSMAVSTAIDPTRGDTPTLRAMDRTCPFVVGLLDRLESTWHGGPLLPRGTALNVNYPLVNGGNGRPSRVEFTRAGEAMLSAPGYVPTGPNAYAIKPVLRTEPEPLPNADTAALVAGHVSITPLDDDWSAFGPRDTELRERLSGTTP